MERLSFYRKLKNLFGNKNIYMNLHETIEKFSIYLHAYIQKIVKTILIHENNDKNKN